MICCLDVEIIKYVDRKEEVFGAKWLTIRMKVNCGVGVRVVFVEYTLK